jgi:hypothetical protein
MSLYYLRFIILYVILSNTDHYSEPNIYKSVSHILGIYDCCMDVQVLGSFWVWFETLF